ncbi:MAG: CBS domain-containing protein [Candidatus Omnitrophota bacterium]|nr:CBS domain-containing protein [Candidatus Omnitrophota bacterium]
MTSVGILKDKGKKVWSVRANQTIYEALQMLVTHKIGAVVVREEGGKIEGIVSERDVMRVCFHNPENFSRLPVKKVMTKCVVVAKPSDSIEELMEVMTQNRVRHLPVLEDGELQGLVSIGDVVKAGLKESVENNKQLMEYISH